MTNYKFKYLFEGKFLFFISIYILFFIVIPVLVWGFDSVMAVGDESAWQLYGKFFLEYLNEPYINRNYGEYFPSLSTVFPLFYVIDFLDIYFNENITFLITYVFFQNIIPSLSILYLGIVVCPKYKNILFFMPSMLLYCYNPFVLLNTFNYAFFIAQCFFPFTLAAFLKFLENVNANKFSIYIFLKYSAFINSSLFFAQTAINHFQYISVYLFGFLVFIVPFIYSSINKKKINNVIYLFVFISINFLIFIFQNYYWIADFLNFYQSDLGTIFSELKGKFVTIANTNPLDTIRFLASWALRTGTDEYLYAPYMGYYWDTVIGAIFSGAYLLMLIYPLKYVHKDKYLFNFYIFLIIGLVFSTGGFDPMAFIFNFFYNEFDFFSLFREPNKFILSLLVPACIIINYIFINNYEKN